MWNSYFFSIQGDRIFINSSCGNELDILKKLNVPKSNVVCYSINQTLFTLIPHSSEKNGKVTIILRNESGKFIWESNLVWNEKTFISPNDPPKVDETTPKNHSTQTIDEEVVNSLQSFFTEKDHNLFKEISKAMKEEMEKEILILQSKNYGRDVNIEMKRPPPIQSDPSDQGLIRIFQSLLGHLSVNSYDQFESFEKTKSSFENFLSIDDIPERETIQIGVLYINNPMEEDIFKCSAGNKNFDNFVKGLGNMVDLSLHQGFKGDLQNGFAPYYSNYSNSFFLVIFFLLLMKFFIF